MKPLILLTLMLSTMVNAEVDMSTRPDWVFVGPTITKLANVYLSSNSVKRLSTPARVVMATIAIDALQPIQYTEHSEPVDIMIKELRFNCTDRTFTELSYQAFSWDGGALIFDVQPNTTFNIASQSPIHHLYRQLCG